MWHIVEPNSLDRLQRSVPVQVWKKYELWKNLVRRHGPDVLRSFPGFRDEKLKGDRSGQRSSRLNLQYRVIYRVRRDMVTIQVVDVTPHDYR